MTKENESLLIYRKITDRYSLIDKSYLYLGCYLISIEVILQDKSNKEKNKKNEISLKNKNKLKELEKLLSEKEYNIKYIRINVLIIII